MGYCRYVHFHGGIIALKTDISEILPESKNSIDENGAK